MKKNMILGSIACALASMLSLASCAKVEPYEASSKKKFTISVGKEAFGADAKASIESNKLVFNPEDQITVWDGVDYNVFRTANGGETASFEGEAAAGAESYIIVSPASAGATVSGNTVTYEIPEIQVATPGSVDPKALISVGRTTSLTEGVVLYNAAGYVKVTIPEGMTVKELHLGGGKGATIGICGKFTFNATTNTVRVANVAAMRTFITLVPQEGKSVIDPGTYYIAVRPKPAYDNGLVLAYVNENNQLCKWKTATSYHIERGHILPFPVLDASKFTPNTKTAVLRTSGDEVQFTGRVKKIAGGSGTASEVNSTIEHVVFKAHSLFDGTFNNTNNAVSSSKGTETIFAYLKESTLYVCTEAPAITLQIASNYLLRNFANLKSVTFNDVVTESGATLERMFSGCSNLELVDFGNCDFSKVANMQFMFDNCPKLQVARFGTTATTSLQYCKAMFMGCTWMTELNLGPNFTISHLADKTQCNNMFYQTAADSNAAAGTDVSKKCKLYMRQAEYDAARLDKGGVCANSALNAARFYFTPVE